MEGRRLARLVESEGSASGLQGLPTLRRAYEFVAHELLVLILSGRFRPGDRLPGERELAAHLGVSRPTVRQALGVLAAHGLVETRVGSGTFVVSPSPESEPRSAALSASLREVMEARLALEVAAARLAGRRSHTRPAALELLRATVESLERSANPRSFPTKVDLAFHRTVVHSAGNPYLADVLAPLWQALAATVAPVLASQWTAEHTARMAAEHRAVLEALRVGDAELAAFAMERHLRSELARLGDRVSVEGPPPRFFA